MRSLLMTLLIPLLAAGRAASADMAQYDAARDALGDVRVASERAARDGRRVLVVVGGDWCIWCFWLDRHLAQDAMARAALQRSFEIVYVYYGDDNRNEAFFAGKPDFELFPHLYVLDTDGVVLESAHAGVLVGESRFDTQRIEDFAARWLPADAP